MKLSIIAADYHRNGVCGAGFYAVIFNDPEQGRMIATLFAEPGHCAVYKLSELEKENIAFAGGNSWRGDRYADALRPKVAEFVGHDLFA
jgi:hypothetical protein